MVKLRCQIKTMPRKGSPLMSILNTISLESNKKIKINFNGGNLSSDGGLTPHQRIRCKGRSYKACEKALQNQ